MPTWNEFLTEYIKSWRNSFEQFTELEKEVTFGSWHAHYLFVKPCQIEVIASKKAPRIIWIVTHDDRKDLKFDVYAEVKTDLETFFRERKRDDPRWFERFGQIYGEYKRFEKNREVTEHWGFGINFFYVLSKRDLLSENPKVLATREVKAIARDARKYAETETIESKTEEIKSEAEKVLDENLRERLLKAAEEIEYSLNEMKRLDEHERKISAIEGEIDGVRKLIGKTKEYQDWKALVSEVAEFKKTPHVAKELFESEIKRLDQRIDALREIKFWSRRTIIDIILAVIATASTIIVALFAAGVLHF